MGKAIETNHIKKCLKELGISSLGEKTVGCKSFKYDESLFC